MSSLNEALRELRDLPMEGKVGLAAAAYTKLLPTLRQVDDDESGMTLLSLILGSAAGADGKLTAHEVALIQAILRVEGLDRDSEGIAEMVRNAADRKELVRDVAGVINEEDKKVLVTLVAAVCAIDQRIVPDEVEYIVSLR